MSTRAVLVDSVWKKFRRGERHDTLKDLFPAMARRVFRPKPSDALAAEEFWAVKDLSFQVNAGEALGIIGPNGAGKSTTLKLLTRILKPTRGRCEIRGRVGALIEVAAGFHQDLTGRENVYLQGAIMGMKKVDIDRRFEEIVEFSGVRPFIDTQVKRYSSGMQARLGFSVAAHLEPDVLFVDEVLSVGDMSFQTRCMDKMAEQLRNGVAVVFVSHNLQSVATLCRRAVVVAQGTKIFEGPPGPAIDAYLKTSASTKSRWGSIDTFSVIDVRLEVDRGTHANGTTTVPPHTRCRVIATLESHVDSPPCAVGFGIDRTEDMFSCYAVHSGELGEPLFQARAGERISVCVEFSAHFTRGHYQVNLRVRDPHAGVFHMFVDNAVTFVVDESRSWSGLVDVEPRVVIDTHPDALLTDTFHSAVGHR